MNLIQLSEESVINLDHVISFHIIDIPDEKGNIKWAILFQIDLIDNIKVIPHSPDEDEYETAHCQLREYNYASEISPLYDTLKKAEDVLEVIVKKFTEVKKEKEKKK